MKAFALIILTLTAYGCRTPQQKLDRLLKKHPELMQADTLSARTDTVWRDTTIYIGRDSAALEIPDSVTQKTVTTGRVTVRYVRVPGKAVRVECDCDSVAVAAKLPHTVTAKVIRRTITKTVPARLAVWQKLAAFLMMCGAFALGVFITRSLKR